MLLQDWRKSLPEPKSKYQVAKDLGVRWTTVWRWEKLPGEKGKTIPQPDMIKKITTYTGGQVTANDWFGDAPVEGAVS